MEDTSRSGFFERLRGAFDCSRPARVCLGSVVSIAFAASLTALAQSTGFAFSRPLARAIALASYDAEGLVITSRDPIFHSIDPDWWNANRASIARAARTDWQRHDWMALTDWLWLVPVALIAGIVWNFAFAGRDRGARTLIASTSVALSGIGLLIYSLWTASYHWWNTSIHLAEGIAGRPIAWGTLALGWATIALVSGLDLGRRISPLALGAQRIAPRA